jgi:hypothetical protein
MTSSTQHPPASTPFLVALAFLWVLVSPGLLLAPAAGPDSAPVEVLVGSAFGVGVLVLTVYALFRLLGRFIQGAPDDPRRHPEVVQTLDSLKATWTLGARQPLAILGSLYGLALHSWLMMGAYLSTTTGDTPVGMSMLFAAVIAVGSLPWFRQLFREVRAPRHYSVHATVDRLRASVGEEMTELSMHALVASVTEETLQLEAGDTRWSGACPPGHGRRHLAEALQAMAGRVEPPAAVEEPEALRRLRGRRAE